MSIAFQASLFAEYGQRVLFKLEASPLGPCISALRAATQGQAAIFEGSGGVLLYRLLSPRHHGHHPRCRTLGRNHRPLERTQSRR